MVGPVWAPRSPDVHQDSPCASAAASFSIFCVSSAGITGDITEHLEVEA